MSRCLFLRRGNLCPTSIGEKLSAACVYSCFFLSSFTCYFSSNESFLLSSVAYREFLLRLSATGIFQREEKTMNSWFKSSQEKNMVLFRTFSLSLSLSSFFSLHFAHIDIIVRKKERTNERAWRTLVRRMVRSYVVIRDSSRFYSFQIHAALSITLSACQDHC